jgi:ankyrin repeat protein
VGYLLEKGADVNQVDSKISTPALEAARQGRIEVLQALIAAGANLDFRNANEENVLDIAMSKGHKEAARLILRTIGDPDYPLESVAFEIATARNPETTKLLMKSTSMMHAYTRSNTEYAWVKWVVDTGGDLVKPKAMHNMMMVAVSDANIVLVRTLLQNGALPDIPSLSLAVVNRDVDIVRLLLDYGADPAIPIRGNKRLNREDNVLLDALLNLPYDTPTCLAILQLLLDTRRFNILAGPSSNQTAFWRVLESDDWVPQLRFQVALMMLDSATDVNYACNGDGGTLMHHVVRHGHEFLADHLLTKGADINSQDTEGRTPFILACDYQSKMISFLLERGADPGLQYEDDRGPLHAAATVGNVEALKILMTIGCIAKDFDRRSGDGWTPLMCALAADQEEAALLLIGHGANLRYTVAVNGRSMLHLAAAFGHERVFEKIMALGKIDVDGKDTLKNSTPLLLVRTTRAVE